MFPLTTVNVGSLLLDNGASYGSGTATHSLTLYRDQTSGALIFSAGTVMWSWGLSDRHALWRGLTAPVSSDVQQAMVNLFADMGVQPQIFMATLQMAQQVTDHTPPVALITTPSSGLTALNGEMITIAGTATDVGGRVAGVESFNRRRPHMAPCQRHDKLVLQRKSVRFGDYRSSRHRR